MIPTLNTGRHMGTVFTSGLVIRLLGWGVRDCGLKCLSALESDQSSSTLH